MRWDELRWKLEAHEHGFGFQVNVPEFFHALLNVVFQSQDVGGGGVSAVHDGQRMLARNADPSAAIALAETGVLHQPGGGNFSLGIERGITGDLQSLGLARAGSTRRIAPAQARDS